MGSTYPRSTAPGNRWRACVCLLAVFLLSAPAWAAAFEAQGMVCCGDDICPLRGHTPKKSSHDSDKEKNSHPVTCDHHGHKSAADCSVACCHPEAPILSAVALFLLPAPAAVAAPSGACGRASQYSVSADSFLIEPVSPPPRS